MKKTWIGACGNGCSQNYNCSFRWNESMIHKIFILRSCGQQSLGKIKPNEYVCILQFTIVAVCKEKNDMLESNLYLYGYWGLNNVGPRRYKVSASLLIVLSFEFPSSSLASAGRWGYLRLCSDAQVSNLLQWRSFLIWKNIPFSLSFPSFVCSPWAWALWIVSGSRRVLWFLGRVRWFPGI